MIISGAGIWYTNIHFTSAEKGGGGFIGVGSKDSGECKNIEFCHMYINSHLCKRYGMEGGYCAVAGSWVNCFVHDSFLEKVLSFEYDLSYIRSA